MTTHYLPYFVFVDEAGREQAVCGEFVTADQLARVDQEPTCDGCWIWLNHVVQGTEPAPPEVRTR